MIIHYLKFKNIGTVGNIEQEIIFHDKDLVLIMGKNMDQKIDSGSSNGAGKTTIIQALSYVFYDQALSYIKKDNLINKINQKGMVVEIEYSIQNKIYRIQRGRKPNILNYYVNDNLFESNDINEGQGENRLTQLEIEKNIGMSHNLFKHIVAFNTIITPFLSLSDSKQREFIEELFGITILSKKAEKLKEHIKETKDELLSEEVRIKTIKESNENIQKTIDDLSYRMTEWENKHNKSIAKLTEEIDILSKFDIQKEIIYQKENTEINDTLKNIKMIDKELNLYLNEIDNINKNVEKYENNIKSIKEKQCHACGQPIHDKKQEELLNNMISKLNKIINDKNNHNSNIKLLLTEKNELQSLLNNKSVNECIYKNIDEALNHQYMLDKLNNDLIYISNEINPYIDQIANLNISAIQNISYEYLNELKILKEHQDFLLKLLVNKDSFIRKKIIDQNLHYLNQQLNFYLEKLGLPHEVIFNNDLSVEISLLGKTYDFDQLSNGEKNRLILSLSFAFRNVWENTNSSLNLLIIDELVDTGMDSNGMECVLNVLKNMSIDQNKNIFIISHRDELLSRVSKTIMAIKEHNFTTYK